MATRIGDNRYRTWFGESTEFHLREEDQLDVMVDNSFVGNWIANNYMEDLRQAALEVLGRQGQLDVRIIEKRSRHVSADDGLSEAAVEGSSLPPGAAPSPPRRSKSARRRLRGTLESFVVGPNSRLAYSAASQLVRSPGDAFNLLFLHGRCGLGKTHLLHGICNGIRASHPALEWHYISGEEFTNEFIYAVKGNHTDRFRARFRNVDVLVIDDIHFLANKKSTQDEFLHTFNAIDASGKAVVLSSDCHPRNISSLSEPLINRLISGMVVEIEPPDFETRRAILESRAGSLVAAEVLDFVAQNVTRNVRELEGALHKLIAIASLAKEPVSLDLARGVINELGEQRNAPTLADIERVAGMRFGVSREQMHSRSRDRTVCLSRAITMYLARKHTGMSFPEIGRKMGDKNHSTVLMATQRIERQLGENAVVSWKTANGAHEAPIKTLVRSVELELHPHGHEIPVDDAV